MGGGLKWIGDRADLDDRRFVDPPLFDVADAVDGPHRMTFTPPASLGRFTFPSPYGTEGIRLTNASNAPNGVEPRLYSYWSNCNNHRGRSTLNVFLGRRGSTPMILSVEKATGDVEIQDVLPWNATGEGCYFSDVDPDLLYFLDGPTLKTYSRGTVRDVFTLDPKYGDDLWQAHSSADDSVHSATVRRRTSEGPYEVLGTVVYGNGRQIFTDALGILDESIVDKSGRYLVIQEKVEGDARNRIIDLRHGGERIIEDKDGALGHLDVGDGIMVGEDDRHEPSALVLWDLANPSAPRKLLHATVWGPGMGHVAVRGGRALLSSNATGELVDVSLKDGSSRVIAPGMVDGSDYDHQLRACVDPLGDYACWVAFVGGRFDAFLVHIEFTPDAHQFPPPPIGEPTVPGPQQYPSEGEGGWWALFDEDVAAVYAEAGRKYPDSEAAYRWGNRTAFDIGAGMDKQQAKVKHLRELKAALGLTGGAANP